MLKQITGALLAVMMLIALFSGCAKTETAADNPAAASKFI
jgi:hypothetical protein